MATDNDKVDIDDTAIYPNSPLSDVVCEVRFAGEMQVECERHRFWDQIRDDYPQILVPHAQQGQAVALQHYRFRCADNTRAVAVALNSLSYSETKYRGHEEFVREFSRLLGTFRRTYPRLGSVKRVGWRYINLIPFTQEEGRLPLNRFLKFQLALPNELFESTGKIDLQWVGKSRDDVTTTIRIANVARKDAPGQEALLFDIDYGREDSTLSWETVPELIGQFRSAGRQTFEQMITDEYRDYLRGNSL